MPLALPSTSPFSAAPRRFATAATFALALLAANPHQALTGSLDEQLAHGGELYAEHCAVCHGEAGEGGAGYPNAIVGTRSLDKFRTARGLYDYNRMMMPFQDPASMTTDEKWDVTAYLMALNEWLDGLEAPLGPDNAAELSIPPR